ncbi:MAG TPA: MFS transporter [candidate division Zixibacteria bacterium]|nr:MFS transporter [candidate division Zixibacteria bacterium]MDD4918876.1 MFS transporter [candidate division Zixibacteria bacterium]MDM7973880.1 MFS transporter [candidate division Zixibacteria bacterium]HOD66654.1 MFS transporter [candidate division Zixibacteria bacterium]HOZ08669.1 MFS transporter [candidate division Zixibacteria bacterium]
MIARSARYLRQFDLNLWILSFGWFNSSMGFSISLPFISIYFYSEFGMSMTEIGVFFGALAFVRSFFQAVGGEASDRIQRRWLLVYSQYARAVSFLAMAASIHFHLGFWATAAALAVNSILGAIFQPAANATVADILPKAQHLDGYAITRSAGNLGWAAGPAIGGFLAGWSYAALFAVSALMALLSGLVFHLLLRVPEATRAVDRFRLRDILTIRDDHHLLRHAALLFLLYLVVAQLTVPFSVYSVEMAGISKVQLGTLYTINGLLVVALQIPVTRLLSRFTLTAQIAMGSFFYAVGYGSVGILVGYHYFALAMVVVTIGEVIMSPPTLTLTSRLAPEGRMGRYMGVHGFVVASGWSFGPLYGGVILDHFPHTWSVAWMMIASLALVSGAGYLWFRRCLPEAVNKARYAPPVTE